MPACILASYVAGFSIWWVVAPVDIYLLLLIYGSVFISSSFYIKTYCKKANHPKKEVAITFDDGPHPGFTPIVLETLDKHQAKAGFFIVGKQISENVELIQKIFNGGHMIGNHSFRHNHSFDLNSIKNMRVDLQRTENELEQITGKKTALFRPPFGVTNPALSKTTKALKYRVVGWSIRSLDTTIKDEKKILKRIINRIEPGAVILLHDTHKAVVPVLEGLLQQLKTMNYNVVRLDEMLGIDAYKNDS